MAEKSNFLGDFWNFGRRPGQKRTKALPSPLRGGTGPGAPGPASAARMACRTAGPAFAPARRGEGVAGKTGRATYHIGWDRALASSFGEEMRFYRTFRT